MSYVPRRGDIVWLDFDPQSGHEQWGRRPALVLSPERYNKAVGLALVCPITNRAKGYPFEVALPVSLDTTGVVLSDQIKSVDWRGRNAAHKDSAPDDVLDEVAARVVALLGR